MTKPSEEIVVGEVPLATGLGYEVEGLFPRGRFEYKRSRVRDASPRDVVAIPRYYVVGDATKPDAFACAIERYDVSAGCDEIAVFRLAGIDQAVTGLVEALMRWATESGRPLTIEVHAADDETANRLTRLGFVC